jgi:hypothetical protein
MIVKRTLVRILMQIFNHLEGESVSPYNKHINNIIKFLIFVINDPRKENGGNHCSVYKFLRKLTNWFKHAKNRRKVNICDHQKK